MLSSIADYLWAGCWTSVDTTDASKRIGNRLENPQQIGSKPGRMYWLHLWRWQRHGRVSYFNYIILQKQQNAEEMVRISFHYPLSVHSAGNPIPCTELSPILRRQFVVVRFFLFVDSWWRLSGFQFCRIIERAKVNPLSMILIHP